MTSISCPGFHFLHFLKNVSSYSCGYICFVCEIIVFYLCPKKWGTLKLSSVSPGSQPDGQSQRHPYSYSVVIRSQPLWFHRAMGRGAQGKNGLVVKAPHSSCFSHRKQPPVPTTLGTGSDQQAGSWQVPSHWETFFRPPLPCSVSHRSRLHSDLLLS